jgi:hypothetical protein
LSLFGTFTIVDAYFLVGVVFETLFQVQANSSFASFCYTSDTPVCVFRCNSRVLCLSLNYHQAQVVNHSPNLV